MILGRIWRTGDNCPIFGILNITSLLVCVTVRNFLGGRDHREAGECLATMTRIVEIKQCKKKRRVGARQFYLGDIFI